MRLRYDVCWPRSTSPRDPQFRLARLPRQIGSVGAVAVRQSSRHSPKSAADRPSHSCPNGRRDTYDIEGVEFAHEGERCSFDTILRIFDIHDAALDRLALIVRGADTSRHDLAAQCGGLFAISLGLSANFTDDHEMLGHGMVMYDALYTWCRSLQHETHNWPTVQHKRAS
jgi:hypothetical protein